MADKLVCVVAVWRIRIHPVRVVSALIGGFLDRRAVHCQLPETQRYKRYRSLPYPHLAPKANSRDPKQARVRARAPSGATARAGRATANGETAARNRKPRPEEESKSRKRNRSENINGNINTRRTRSRRTTKVIRFVLLLLYRPFPDVSSLKTCCSTSTEKTMFIYVSIHPFLKKV